jgi:endonuclease/exonuclease/phosphatase family metal-dependent hydrolase
VAAPAAGAADLDRDHARRDLRRALHVPGPPIRIVTLNLWGDHAPVDARLVVAARGLGALTADAILLQEVRDQAGIGNTARRLAQLMSADWSVVFEPSTPVEQGTEGLAILARGPVAEQRAVELPFARPDERRILLSARLVESDVWLHTTHLHWRLADGVAREAQVVAASAAARGLGGGVHILGGDLNAPPDADEIRFLAGRTTLAGQRVVWQDAFAVARPGERGVTWARRNPMTDELAFLERDRRIDYLFVSPETRAGRGRIVDARVALDGPDADGVWPSDHFAIVADVEV